MHKLTNDSFVTGDRDREGERGREKERDGFSKSWETFQISEALHTSLTFLQNNLSN